MKRELDDLVEQAVELLLLRQLLRDLEQQLEFLYPQLPERLRRDLQVRGAGGGGGDDRRDPARHVHRELAHDRAAGGLRARELGRHLRHHLGVQRGADLFHPERDLAEGDDVVFRGERLADARAVQKRAVGGADVLDLHPPIDEGYLGVSPRDGRIVNRHVARDRPPYDHEASGLEVDGLLARRAQQLEHSEKIDAKAPRRQDTRALSLAPSRAPGPSTPPPPSPPFPRTRAPDRSRPRSPPPPAP